MWDITGPHQESRRVGAVGTERATTMCSWRAPNVSPCPAGAWTRHISDHRCHLASALVPEIFESSGGTQEHVGKHRSSLCLLLSLINQERARTLI